jgi:tetratricopeptide (TPR) repeat protein
MLAGGAAIGFFVGIWAVAGAAAYGYLHRYRSRWRGLAAAISDGDLERAETVWKGLIARLTPTQRRSASVLYYEAGLLGLREDWQAVLAIVEILSNSKDGPQAVTVMVMRARCLAELGRVDEAMKAAGEALFAPDITPMLRAGLMITEGLVQLRRGEYVRALATFERVGPSPVKAIQASCSFHRADTLRALGREKEAIEAYRHVAAVLPLSRRAAHALQRLTEAPPGAYR